MLVTLAAAVALLYFGRLFFITIAFALFLSFAMRPFVSLLERARVPRVIAILLLLFVLIGAIVLLVINVTAQVNQFYVDLPRYQNRIRGRPLAVHGLRQHAARADGQHPAGRDARSVREVKITESPLATTRAFVAQVGETLQVLLYAATVPFLTFFMLKDREKFGRVIDGMLARNPRFGGRRHGRDLADDDRLRARPLVRHAHHGGDDDGRAHAPAASATTTSSGRSPASRSCCPYVGVIFSTVPAVAVAFFQYDGQKALLVLIVYALLQFLEGNILTPAHRRRPRAALPADRHGGLHLLGTALGNCRRGPRRAADLRDQGRLRERPGLEGFARLLGEPDLGLARRREAA